MIIFYIYSFIILLKKVKKKLIYIKITSNKVVAKKLNKKKQTLQLKNLKIKVLISMSSTFILNLN